MRCLALGELEQLERKYGSFRVESDNVEGSLSGWHRQPLKNSGNIHFHKTNFGNESIIQGICSGIIHRKSLHVGENMFLSVGAACMLKMFPAFPFVSKSALKLFWCNDISNFPIWNLEYFVMEIKGEDHRSRPQTFDHNVKN